VNNLPKVVTQRLPQAGFEPMTYWLQVQRSTHCATTLERRLLNRGRVNSNSDFRPISRYISEMMLDRDIIRSILRAGVQPTLDPSAETFTLFMPLIDWETVNRLACSIVAARLDYCNAVLYGVTNKNILRLQ